MLLVLAFICLAGVSRTRRPGSDGAKTRSPVLSATRPRLLMPDGDDRVDPLYQRLSARYGDRLARIAVRFDPRAE